MEVEDDEVVVVNSDELCKGSNMADWLLLVDLREALREWEAMNQTRHAEPQRTNSRNALWKTLCEQPRNTLCEQPR